MSHNAIKELLDLYNLRKDEIRVRLNEFKRVSRDDYFYELAYCLLTPQTNAQSAARAVEHLKKNDYQNRNIDAAPLLFSKDYYIRFHRTKAERLRQLKGRTNRIIELLDDESLNAFDRRLKLVDMVNGYGLKEATHFLRNIGKNEGLAILDRHILRNLQRYGIISDIPASLTPSKYYYIEKEFALFSSRCGLLVDELDLLFWSTETGIILK
jgi:N-glycosylase/DNA lyase